MGIECKSGWKKRFIFITFLLPIKNNYSRQFKKKREGYDKFYNKANILGAT